MNAGDARPVLDELRIRARLLLKSLRRGGADAVAAAERFRTLTCFSDRSVGQLIDDPGDVRLKHALTVLAREHGHDSWAALRRADSSAELRVESTAERAAESAVESRIDRGTLMYEVAQDVLLNRWFASYAEARASLEQQGGYLFPYRHHFYVCESEGVRILGLDPDDPDWVRIGFDWVRPADRGAWHRLWLLRQIALGARAGAV